MEPLTQAVQLIKQASLVCIAGNGGSAAIANHAECDWMKATSFNKDFRSLCANTSVLTMIANDYGYNEVFAKQLAAYNPDCLVLISSSGESENIKKAAAWASKRGVPVIGMSGFYHENSLSKFSTVGLWVNSDDYGVIEDKHSNYMHYISRELSKCDW